MQAIIMLKQILVMIQLITSLGLSVDKVNVGGYPQQIYTIDATFNSQVHMIQILSNNQVLGFETLEAMSGNNYTGESESYSAAGSYNGINSFPRSNTLFIKLKEQLAEKVNYDLGVNGMFYNDSGRPAGMLIMDGELITSQSIGTPMFILRNNGSVEIADAGIKTYLLHNGQKYLVYEVNEGQTNGLISIFTSWNGSSNRINKEHTTIVVKNNQVVETIVSKEQDALNDFDGGLKQGDFLASYQSLDYTFEVNLGDRLEFVVESNFDIETVEDAFQTGGWLVKDSLNIGREFESYMGPTDSMQPRTAIGITKANKVIIKVVDGRKPGVSTGVTGKQLADLFIEEGCISAAYLDGGASSTLVKNGEVINEPSLEEPKKISHGIFFNRDYKNYLQNK